MYHLTFCLIVISGLLSLFPGNSCAEEQRHVLTSLDGKVDCETWELNGDGWYVKKETLHGGKQEGVELITVDNGVMQIVIIPTRGMSIYEVRSKDMRLGWNSPVEGIVHPAFIDLESRGGLGWLEGFNEWMVRCGLEFAGHPGTDEFVNNTGDTATMDLTLHGKIGNIPASSVEVIVDSEPPHRIRVRGIVFEKFFYGPKLKLTAEISVVPGADTFRIDDTITNLGSADQEFQIIYHTNFGEPLLGKGAKLHAAINKIAPMNEEAAKGIDNFATYAGPTRGYIEQVYLVEPLANPQGMTGALLQNAKGDRGASMFWSTKQLPYLTIWKNTAAVEDGYVTGIEPATGYPYNRKIERAAGRVPKLKPGETRQFTIDYGLHADQQSVKSAIKKIETIQGKHPVEVQHKPSATN
ncbi:aldose 1-epimerase family protein [Gimesia panareensis]|uniref:Uncharacterized protein n=1 Tax=Gimesia panareensis TaxID=2527978 RepID=A0A517QCF1_9PLAN|nr:aldose 1-epimerase family protein [Gimesia panareensis]QDT29306.1 hypothetical protein Enr10x_46570 [Gimesia panareensis]QDU52342.1 hypothetical protein Pan110_47180 [Gimesia panareensis]